MHREEELSLAADRANGAGFSQANRRVLGPCTIEEVFPDTAGKGRHICFSFPSVFSLLPEEESGVCRALSTLLSEESARLVGRTAGARVLLVGLGNPRVTVDALGPLTADKIRPTATLPPDLCRKVGCSLLSVFCPLVPALTGMESAALARAAVGTFRPDLVLIADAMATRSQARLGCTAEISDRGIIPGSGVGEGSLRLDREYLGTPVLSVGFPVVLDATDLFAGKDGGGVFDYLVPHEGECACHRLSTILARAVENVFGVPSLF